MPITATYSRYIIEPSRSTGGLALLDTVHQASLPVLKQSTSLDLVFAPDICLRVINEQIVILSGSSTCPICTLDSRYTNLATWLFGFLTPTNFDVALTRLPPTERETAVEAIERLRNGRALVAADSSQLVSRQGDEVVARTRRSLKRLSRDIYEVACDLRGFGPYADPWIAAHTGSGVESHLTALQDAVRALLHQLHAMRAGYLSAQLTSLGVTDQSRELRLHIGCGSRQLRGWINIDTYPAPLAMNALWDLPFSDASVKQVFVSRMPELLFFPIEVRRFLSELHRVLASGSILQIAVTECEARSANHHTSLEAAYRNWTDGLEHRSRIDYLLAFSGSDCERSGDRRARKSACGVSALMYLLKEECFTDIVQVEALKTECEEPLVDYDPPMTGVVARHCASYIEARKPVH